MVFRKLRTKRQIRDFQENADPALLAQEIAALKRENAEADNSTSGPLLPTDLESEILNRRNQNPRFRMNIFGIDGSFSDTIQNPLLGSENIQHPND